MENCWTSPRRKSASGMPVKTPVNEYEPYGDGGWTTLSRSHRQSSPSFSAWRPLIHERESATSDTPVLKSDCVFGGDPNCWSPLMTYVGICTAERCTVRRVSPTRISLRTVALKTCWYFEA